MQISDNPELFQPLVEENIRAANAGEIINDKVWGQRVRAFPAQLAAAPVPVAWPQSVSAFATCSRFLHKPARQKKGGGKLWCVYSFEQG